MVNLLFPVFLMLSALAILSAAYKLWQSFMLSKRELEIIRSLCKRHLNEFYPTLLKTFSIGHDEFKKRRGIVEGVIDLDCYPLKRINLVIEIVGHEDYIIKSVKDYQIESYRKQEP